MCSQQHSAVVLERHWYRRISGPGLKFLVHNTSRAGLPEPVGGLDQPRQVVDVRGDGGMLGPEGLLVDLQRAAHQRLGLREPVGVRQQLASELLLYHHYGCLRFRSPAQAPWSSIGVSSNELALAVRSRINETGVRQSTIKRLPRDA
jgi:hypothetical protein